MPLDERCGQRVWLFGEFFPKGSALFSALSNYVSFAISFFSLRGKPFRESGGWCDAVTLITIQKCTREVFFFCRLIILASYCAFLISCWGIICYSCWIDVIWKFSRSNLFTCNCKGAAESCVRSALISQLYISLADDPYNSRWVPSSLTNQDLIYRFDVMAHEGRIFIRLVRDVFLFLHDHAVVIDKWVSVKPAPVNIIDMLCNFHLSSQNLFFFSSARLQQQAIGRPVALSCQHPVGYRHNLFPNFEPSDITNLQPKWTPAFASTFGRNTK